MGHSENVYCYRAGQQVERADVCCSLELMLEIQQLRRLSSMAAAETGRRYTQLMIDAGRASPTRSSCAGSH